MEEISVPEISRFLHDAIVHKKASASYQKHLLGAYKLYMKEIANQYPDISALYPSRPAFRLPAVLDKKEVAAILAATGNLKHKAILSLIYGGGCASAKPLTWNLQE